MEKEGRVVLAPLKKYLHIYNKEAKSSRMPGISPIDVTLDLTIAFRGFRYHEPLGSIYWLSITSLRPVTELR